MVTYQGLECSIAINQSTGFYLSRPVIPRIQIAIPVIMSWAVSFNASGKWLVTLSFRFGSIFASGRCSHLNYVYPFGNAVGCTPQTGSVPSSMAYNSS